MVFGQPTQPPETPTIEHQDVLTLSHEDQRLFITAESGSASLPPGKEDNSQGVVEENAYEPIACSISRVIESSMEIYDMEKPYGGQEAYPEDFLSDLQGHPADSTETSTYWDDAFWALELEGVPCDTIRDNFLDEDKAVTGSSLGNQDTDEFLFLVEGFEMPDIGSPSGIRPRETSTEYQEGVNMPDDAIDFLKETRNNSLIRGHRSLSHVEPQGAPSAFTEQMQFLNGSAPTPETINGEVMIIEGSSNSSDFGDSTLNMTAEQSSRAGSQHRVQFRTPLITGTNSGEAMVMEDSGGYSGASNASELAPEIAADQRPWEGSQARARPQTPIITDTSNAKAIAIEGSSDASDASYLSDFPDITTNQRPREGPQPRARSRTPIITDTNNGEAIVIEDSSDLSDVSDLSELPSDITTDQRTWAGSQSRVRSRRLRVMDGMVQWSDTCLAKTNKTTAQKIWTDAQNLWKSTQAIECLAKNKEVKKFDKMMTKARGRIQRNEHTVTVQVAEKLYCEFKKTLPHLKRKLQSSKQRKILKTLDSTLKDLYTLVEVTAVMTELPEGDGHKDDSDYKPRGATRKV